jgi:hypothetical protein
MAVIVSNDLFHYSLRFGSIANASPVLCSIIRALFHLFAHSMKRSRLDLVCPLESLRYFPLMYSFTFGTLHKFTVFGITFLFIIRTFLYCTFYILYVSLL